MSTSTNTSKARELNGLERAVTAIEELAVGRSLYSLEDIEMYEDQIVAYCERLELVTEYLAQERWGRTAGVAEAKQKAHDAETERLTEVFVVELDALIAKSQAWQARYYLNATDYLFGSSKFDKRQFKKFKDGEWDGVTRGDWSYWTPFLTLLEPLTEHVGYSETHIYLDSARFRVAAKAQGIDAELASAVLS